MGSDYFELRGSVEVVDGHRIRVQVTIGSLVVLDSLEDALKVRRG